MSDSLKQALDGMEAAWRRLREVLDGPDVAAALVERSPYNDVRSMSTAPSDRTVIRLHFVEGDTYLAYFSAAYDAWRTPGFESTVLRQPIGWSPVK